MEHWRYDRKFWVVDHGGMERADRVIESLLAQGWDIWRPHEVMVQYKDSIRVTHTP
jgi:hypothetical protein